MSKRAKTLGAILLFALVLSFLPAASLGAPGQPEAHLERFGPLDHFDPSVLSTPALPLSAGSPALQSPQSPDNWQYLYSRIAYQSLRDGNWEIYYSSPDQASTNLIRLTNDPASDILPRLTRGCSRIVFASNRDGNYNLYAVNNNGTGLVRLNSHSADDVYPAWSPDGSKIAFQSYRDGQAEVYVMNADGTNPQRLTYNPDYDGQPTWSPDGLKIAFTSYRNGGYRIWTMYYDGSSQFQISNLPYSGDPTWSPDGRTIAFSADGNYDGWLETWRMNSDGGVETYLNLEPASTNVDVMPYGWSWDSLYISYTSLHYIKIGEDWYWNQAVIKTAKASDGSSTYMMTTTQENMYPDWQSTDLSVPSSYLRELPPYSPASGFTVEWTGYDPGEAKITSYEVQKLEPINSPEWKAWWETANTSATYSGTVGETVSFRVRAKDGAKNVEPFQVNEVVQTRLYRFGAAGQVRDNRGDPVPSVLGMNNPVAMNEDDTSGADGWLRSYYTTDSAILQLSQAGFGALPGISLASGANYSKWWGLPPLDNQLSNGNFESGSLAGWQSTPVNAAGTSLAYPLSGALSADLGVSLRTDLQDIFQDTAYPISCALARDAQGRLHAFWSDSAAVPGDQTPSLADIFYSYQLPSGDWSTPVIVSTPHDANSYGPAVAFGPDGSLHMIWGQDASDTKPAAIYYTVKSPGGSWSPAELVTSGQPIQHNDQVETFTLVVDGANGLQFVWHSPNSNWYTTRQPGGSWSTPERLDGDSATQAIDLAPDGRLHRVYYAASGSLLHVSRLPGGAWSAPEVLANSSDPKFIDLTTSSDGALHVAWGGLNLFTSRRPPAGTWESPVLVYSTSTAAGIIAIDAFGTDVLLVIQGNQKELVLQRNGDGPWTPPVGLDFYCYRRVLVYGAPGRADLLCNKYNLNGDPIQTSPIFVIAGPQRSLSQTVNLPPSLHAPTLALGYRVEGVAGAGRFEVLVNNQAIFSTTQLADWNQFSHDMAPWAGQVVELAFRVEQLDPAQPYIVHLDDLSIGSWLTPRIERLEPQTVPPGFGGVILLHGQNFIDLPQVQVGGQPAGNVTWLDDATLRFTLPAGLGQGIYNLQVTNPGGQSALRVNGLQVGGWISLPLIHRGR